MIYTRDGRSLKNVNSLWYWKWRSMELQAKLQKGKLGRLVYILISSAQKK